MGRYAGSRGAMKKQRKKIARRKGVPITSVGKQMASNATGLRINKPGLSRPGAKVKVRQPRALYVDRFSGETIYEKRSGMTSSNVDNALKLIKKMNPETLQVTKRRKDKK